jgi:alkylation response protein AidB-like acyl-CoA dehydrogenase
MMSVDNDHETLTMLADAAKSTLRKLGGMNLARSIQRQDAEAGRSLWKTFAQQGWLGVLVPEELGGSGLGMREMAAIAEELGRVATALPYAGCAVMPGMVLASSGHADGAAHLTALMDGTAHYALAWQEHRFPEQCARAGNLPATSAVAGRVSGIKYLVVTEGTPDYYIVTAQQEGRPVICLVEAGGRGANGIEVETQLAVDGTHYQTVVLREAAVASVLAEGHQATASCGRAIEAGTLATSAELYGVMSAALKLTLEYMRTRVQFGRPIGAFQALQHRAADLFIQKDLSYSVLGEALEAVSQDMQGSERQARVARAKARCSDAALRIVKDAVQLHGAIGYTDEYDLGCLVKRAMVLGSWLGNGTAQRRAYFDAIYSHPAAATAGTALA